MNSYYIQVYLANKVNWSDQRRIQVWGNRAIGPSWNLNSHLSAPVFSFVTSEHFIGWIWKDLQKSQFTDFTTKSISKLSSVQTQPLG